MEILDARGLECPLPVVKTKELLKEIDEVKVLVDNEIAIENLTKFAGHALKNDRNKYFWPQDRRRHDHKSYSPAVYLPVCRTCRNPRNLRHAGFSARRYAF